MSPATAGYDALVSSLRAPAPRPCESCPYRRDVPSGIWAEAEYDKLPRYDADTAHQPPQLFQCHQHDAGSGTARVCGGWAACHGPDLLAPRIALIEERIDPATFQAITEYTSPVPLFATGAEAAAHGRKDIDLPGKDAENAMNKISRNRNSISPH
ncbi:DUF6283 family protein [Streptomyces chartreusis]|uniref:DUF6283 family protein n=1 Tax=Streptomyces chartreusis TaxID=1969 RepID=UPI00380DEEE0